MRRLYTGMIIMWTCTEYITTLITIIITTRIYTGIIMRTCTNITDEPSLSTIMTMLITIIIITTRIYTGITMIITMLIIMIITMKTYTGIMREYNIYRAAVGVGRL
jgi:hypothetical protein